MKNIEVRQAIEKKRLKHYEVAERLGVDACTCEVKGMPILEIGVFVVGVLSPLVVAVVYGITRR